MKKISAFRSKGGMKFLFSLLIVLIMVVLFLLELNQISDYIFIISVSYYVLIVLYYNFNK